MLDAEALIRQIVQQETIYLRTYTGQVVGPAPGTIPAAGLMLVLVGALGQVRPDQACVCRPDIYARAFAPPAPGALVRVYFLDGDRSQPVYGPGASEGLPPGGMPLQFNGAPTTNVVFESLLQQSIIVDDATGAIKLNPLIGVQLGLALNSMVLGEVLAAWMATFIGVFSAHTHVVTGTLPTGPVAAVATPTVAAPPVVPPNLLSLRHKLD